MLFFSLKGNGYTPREITLQGNICLPSHWSLLLKGRICSLFFPLRAVPFLKGSKHCRDMFMSANTVSLCNLAVLVKYFRSIHSPYLWVALSKNVPTGHLRTAKAQIRLRRCTVWSGPSLSTTRIIGYYRMYQWRTKAQMSPFVSPGW